jgi:hypothetical protein
LFAVGVVVIVFNGDFGPRQSAVTTAGEEAEPTRADTPAGWKAFRTGEVRVWVPELVDLVEGDDTDPQAPVVDRTSWTNWQVPNLVLPAKPVSNASGMWFWVNSGRLSPTFLAEHGRTPAACEVALKLLEDASSPGEGWSDATLGGLPARQRVTKVTAPDPPQKAAVTTTRAVIRGETLYWCAVICTEADASGPVVSTFLDSFRFEYGTPTGVKAVLPPDPPPLPAPKLPVQWRTYQGDGFSVGVKEAAQVTADGLVEKVAGDPFFKSKRNWVFEYTAGGKGAYLSVTAFVFRPSLAREFQVDPTAALDGLLKVFAQGPNLADQKVTAGKLGGVDAKQVVQPDLVSRLAVRGDTLYVLSVGEPGIGNNEATVKPFFDSFRFDRR